MKRQDGRKTPRQPGNRPRKKKPSRQIEKLPVAIATREGKTAIRQFEGRRFVRFGEVRGKTLAWVELYTAGPDGHFITVRFQDQTGLHLEITPLFTIKPEYFNIKTGNYELLKKWPEIRSER
jgi:hypothetical protein